MSRFDLDFEELKKLVIKTNMGDITFKESKLALDIIQSLKTSKDPRSKTFTNSYKFKQTEKKFIQLKKSMEPPPMPEELFDLSELIEISNQPKCSNLNECVCILKDTLDKLVVEMGKNSKEGKLLLLEALTRNIKGQIDISCKKGSFKKRKNTKRKKAKSSRRNRTKSRH